MEGSSDAKKQLDSFSRFDRTPTCDRQTDTRLWLVDPLPRMQGASRGKNRAKYCTNVRRIPYFKLHSRLITFKIIRGHCKRHESIGAHFLLAVSRHKQRVCLAPFLRYGRPFTVYVPARDLQEPFSFACCRSISPARGALSSKPAGRRCCSQSMGQTD